MTVIGGLRLADIRKVFCTMRIVQLFGRRIPHREGPVIIDDHSPELFPAGFGSKRRLDNAECTNQCRKYLFHRRLHFSGSTEPELKIKCQFMITRFVFYELGLSCS